MNITQFRILLELALQLGDQLEAQIDYITTLLEAQEG
jgi:hypothetical protein